MAITRWAACWSTALISGTLEFQYYDGGGTQRLRDWPASHRELDQHPTQTQLPICGMGDPARRKPTTVRSRPFRPGLLRLTSTARCSRPISALRSISLGSQGPAAAYIWDPATWAEPIPHTIALNYPCAHPVAGLSCGGTERLQCVVPHLTQHGHSSSRASYPNPMYFERIGAGQCYGSEGRRRWQCPLSLRHGRPAGGMRTLCSS